MWEYDDDLRWCANLALGASFVLMMFGVIIGAYLEESKCYVMIMSCGFALLFALAGAGIHYHVWRENDRRTIKTKKDGRWLP